MRRLICICLLLLPALSAAEIYRWTDANGQIHFGEQPGAGAQRIEVKPQVVERDAATREREERLRKVLDALSQEQAAVQQKQAQKNAKRNEECSKLRQSLAELEQGGVFFSQDAQGERTYYSDQQVEAARSKLAAQLSSNCQ